MFKIRESCRDYFKPIRKQRNLTDFDLYYFCLVLGLKKRQHSEPSMAGGSVSVFTTNFTTEYVPTKELIISLVVCAEAERHGLEMTEKKSVVQLFERLTDGDSITRLSSAGAEAMNSYASGGFDFLRENLQARPEDFSQFLVAYAELLSS